jgi:hypothetical protein
MTKLLEEMISQIHQLSPEEQDAIALMLWGYGYPSPFQSPSRLTKFYIVIDPIPLS